LSLPRSSFAIALFTRLMGLSTNVWQFFGERAVTEAFAGFSFAAIALVASQVPERRLGHPLNGLASGQLVGSLIGQSSAVRWPMLPAAIVPRFSGVPALPAPVGHWSEPW
jgi:MFS family permease